MFRALRGQILNHLRTRAGRVFAVTSSLPGEGKTTIALNLAFSIASYGGIRLFLIEADLRQPKISAYLETTVEHGLDDYLDGEATIAESLLGVESEKFCIMPVRHPRQDSAELLSNSRLHALQQAILASDPQAIIIYDAPPMLRGDESLALLNLTNGAVFVVQDGIPQDVLKQSLLLVGQEKLIGTILNKTVGI